MGFKPANSSTQAARQSRRAILLALSPIVVLFISEIIQWSILPAPHPLRRRPGPAVFTFHTNGVSLPGVSGETRFTTESHGLRYPREIEIPKPPGVRRVVCVGGSTTECTYLDDEYAWPRRLERSLRHQLRDDRLEVINAGFSGMTSSDHVEQIEQLLLHFEPDCIVLMAGMNDHLRRQSLKRPDSPDWKRRLMDRSMTVRRLVCLGRWLTDEDGQPGEISLDPTGSVYEQRREVSRRIPVADSTAAFERLPDPLPVFRENVSRIAEACHARAIHLVLVTHPSIYRADLSAQDNRLLWLGSVLTVDGQQAPIAWHQRELARLNDWLRQFAKERGLTLIDADQRLPKSRATFYDDCHFNVAGSAAMTELADPVLFSILHNADKP